MRFALACIVVVLLNASCGGGDDWGTTSSTPLQMYKNCRWEWPLPGVPSSGSPVFRCTYVSECKTTPEVCEGLFFCPPEYREVTCVACRQDRPLFEC